MNAVYANGIESVEIGTETVRVGDNVGENTSPWIKMTVIAIEDGGTDSYGKQRTSITVVFTTNERHGNHIARRGRTRRYSVNGYGVSDVRKVG